MSENYFAVLNAINVNDKTEKKNGLTYLSWAWAWGEIKKRYPDANYTIYENADGLNYHTDGRTCWVKTGVTVAGIEHIEYLPVMDARNRSIPLAQVDSFVVNKTIQRSLTKAIARHGLGLYIYAGEDLPEDAEPDKKAGTPVNQSTATPIYCEDCKAPITAHGDRTAQQMAAASKAKFGRVLCVTCAKDEAARNAAGGAA